MNRNLASFHEEKSHLNVNIVAIPEKQESNLLATIDIMERGVKLATYFIATVTKNSYEFKDLLHLAEHN